MDLTGQVADASVEQVAARRELEQVVVCRRRRHLFEDADRGCVIARLR